MGKLKKILVGMDCGLMIRRLSDIEIENLLEAAYVNSRWDKLTISISKSNLVIVELLMRQLEKESK